MGYDWQSEEGVTLHINHLIFAYQRKMARHQQVRDGGRDSSGRHSIRIA